MSHPPSLTTIVKRALLQGGECAVARGSALLVAVSGGPDSMALLSVLARVAPKLDVKLAAHGVDHGLRRDAMKELDLAETFANELGVPFARTKVEVDGGSNLQARAREARWRALIAAARSLRPQGAIATAHHADDRAETFLIRLLRGAGVRGLAVLPPRADASPFGDPSISILRPLLRATRQDVLLHLERHHVPFAHDPSNRDPRFLRVRIRHEVMPLLVSLDPQIVRHIEAVVDEIVGGQEPAPSQREHPPETSLAWTSLLPRSTQRAIERLTGSTSSRDARVWLPNGLVLQRQNASKAPSKKKKRAI